MNKCFSCGTKEDLMGMYGYRICGSCKKKLRLFDDKTILRYLKENKGFEEEMRSRIDLLSKDYKKKKIKLLYILERIKKIT